MKVCRKCERELSIDNFYVEKTGKIRAVCKECEKKRNAVYKARHKHSLNIARKRYRKEVIDSIKDIKLSACCCVCNESAIECLDFHHTSGKDGTISRMVRSKGLKVVLDEIKKCILVCSNCHRKIHAGTLTLEGVGCVCVDNEKGGTPPPQECATREGT